MRRSIPRLPWRQFSRRPFTPLPTRLQESQQPIIAQSPSEPSPPSIKPSANPTLVAAFEPPQTIPPAASSLSSLPPELLEKTACLPDPGIGSIKHEPAPRGAPVAAGYNDRIYRVCAARAQAGQNPSPTDLNDLFRMMLHDSPNGELKDEAIAVWREMRSRGISPTKEGFRALFAITAGMGDVLAQDELVQALIDNNIHLDSHMLHSLIEGLMFNNEVDRALLFLRDLRTQGVVPKRQTYNLLISTCAEMHEPQETFKLLLDFKDAWGDNSVPERNWWIVLEACANDGYLLGTLHTWQTLQNVRDIEFPEGLCLSVLSVAAKHGHPALATSVFDELAKLKVTWQEHHFLPLVEAYVRAGDIRQAFIVISIMRESCVTPPYLPHLQILVDQIAKNTKALDRAFFLLQDIREKEDQKVDIVAFNALLQAAVRLEDPSRAVSTYQETAKFGITPDIETYNLLLSSIQKAAHMDLMMVVLKDMKAAQMSPNSDTFVHVIMTCALQPPPDYEPAFTYLEEMKASGFIPPSAVYSILIKKCIFGNDDRAYGLIEEMKRMGHLTQEIEKWAKMTVVKLGEGRMKVWEQYQQNRVERMSVVREEERELTMNVISSLSQGGQPSIDEFVEMERIEKMKKDGLLV